MEITIKKVAERNGVERFVLVNPQTREVLTSGDASEPALRRFFAARGVAKVVLDRCLERARDLYAAANSLSTSEDDESDVSDLLQELGFGGDDNEAD